jgi:hypothetical protein
LLDQRGLARTIDVPGVPNAAPSDGTDLGALELDPVLRLTSIEFSGADALLHFTSVSGKAYSLENTADVVGSGWLSRFGYLPGSGGILTFRDTNALILPKKFYRIRTQ